MKKTVFFISDGTGITAETLGHSLLTQFEHIKFEYITIPYVNSEEKANTVIANINETAERDGERPLVFVTLINAIIRQRITEANCLVLDFFNTFIVPIEAELKAKSSYSVGRTHGMQNYQSYTTRIDAVNYALTNDDGITTKNYDKADLILLGVSRSGKTPTCLYLALQFGLFAANYPLTEEDLDHNHLPKALEPFRKKLFGLTIDAKRLQAIRHERRPNSNYSALEQCQKEIQQAEKLFHAELIPFLSSTTRSIEEISTMILASTGVKRRLF
jgi:[pyruvate, water dikinase]-phosphate phosphotransferase / [pyruvate, water dikinase] kinase